MSFDPSEEQGAVIDSTAPVVFVFGGAGTGKTTTAAAAAARRLAADDASRAVEMSLTPLGSAPTLAAARRVLFLSFSRTSVR